ncbi:unnamed protein product, partial [Prorocentrum cordatum]
MVEESASKFRELVSAERSVGPAIAGRVITSGQVSSWTSLCELLRHFAYKPDGPEPTLPDLGARFRTAWLLCSTSQSPSWSAEERAQATAALQALADGVRQCSDLLPEIVKIEQLLRATAPTAEEMVLTQWSSLKLSPGAASAAHQGTLGPETCRRVAALAVKKHARVWTELGGRPAVLWAPTDASALGRLLNSYMDLPAPQHIRFVVLPELFPGSHTVEAIQDLWWHPLLSERGVPVVKKVEYTPSLPTTCCCRESVILVMTCAVTAVPAYTLDFPATALPQVLRILEDPGLQRVHASAPLQSMLSAVTKRRMSMEWTFPPGTPELQIALRRRGSSSPRLPATRPGGVRLRAPAGGVGARCAAGVGLDQFALQVRRRLRLRLRRRQWAGSRGIFPEAAWNEQALFAADLACQRRKTQYIGRIARSCDAALAKTRSEAGAAEAWRGPGSWIMSEATSTAYRIQLAAARAGMSTAAVLLSKDPRADSVLRDIPLIRLAPHEYTPLLSLSRARLLDRGTLLGRLLDPVAAGPAVPRRAFHAARAVGSSGQGIGTLALALLAALAWTASGFEGLEDAWQRGVESGFVDGRKQGMREGWEQGLEEGHKRGLEEGRQRGLSEGFQQSVSIAHKEWLALVAITFST